MSDPQRSLLHEETSGGYDLYVPESRLWDQPRFVAVDDQNNAILSVEYEKESIRNITPWSSIALHTIQHPAIVFNAANNKLHEKNKGVHTKAFLVSVDHSDENGVFEAKVLGVVEVAQFPESIINWDNLSSTKKPHIITEIRHGLYRHLCDNRPDRPESNFVFTTPAEILNAMPRPWHSDSATLNAEMDSRFVGASRISANQKWKIYA